MSTQIYLMEAVTLPPAIHDALPEIREEALDACMKVVADRFAELGYEVSGDFTPGEVFSMEAAVEAFARSMALNNEAICKLNNESEPPELGARVRLIGDVERFPHFIAQEGSTGVVVYSDSDYLRVKMDDDLPGAEDWDNEIVWSIRDGDDPAMDLATEEII